MKILPEKNREESKIFGNVGTGEVSPGIPQTI